MYQFAYFNTYFRCCAIADVDRKVHEEIVEVIGNEEPSYKVSK